MLNTARGKRMAVNTVPLGHQAHKFLPVDRNETYYQHGAHQPHRATCTRPKVRQERKRYV